MKNLIITVLIIVGFSCSQQATESEKSAPSKSLHEATFFGDVKIVNQHIAAGTDLNQKDDYGSTPLNVAITFDKTEVAIALINGGADLTITAPDGSTPLHSAAFFGRTAIVKALLDKKVDREEKNQYGATPLEAISAPFSALRPIYDQLSKDLGPFGFKLDYDALQLAHDEIKLILQQP